MNVVFGITQTEGDSHIWFLGQCRSHELHTVLYNVLQSFNLGLSKNRAVLRFVNNSCIKDASCIINGVYDVLKDKAYSKHIYVLPTQQVGHIEALVDSLVHQIDQKNLDVR